MRISLIILCFYSLLSCNGKLKNEDDFVIVKVNPKLENVSLYWKDDDGMILKSIKNLKNKVERDKKRLKFAMNGGMFEMNNSPKGLYIENFKILNKLDTLSGKVIFISILMEYFISQKIMMLK